MEKLNEQQLRALAELPDSKKYFSVKMAAEEELARRSRDIREILSKFENKYFIAKNSTHIQAVKTSKWNQNDVGKYYEMDCEYVEFTYDDRPKDFERQSFMIAMGKLSWTDDEIRYFEKYYTEVTEEEWLKWVEKFKVFHSAMYKLKDWE